MNCASLGHAVVQRLPKRGAHPEAKRGAVGLQAQMNTSEECPSSVVTREAGISSGPASGSLSASPPLSACMSATPQTCAYDDANYQDCTI